MVPNVPAVPSPLFYLPRDTVESFERGLNDWNGWNDLNKLRMQ